MLVEIVHYFSHLTNVHLISCEEHSIYISTELGKKKKKKVVLFTRLFGFSLPNIWKGLGVRSDCNSEVLAGNC